MFGSVVRRAQRLHRPCDALAAAAIGSDATEKVVHRPVKGRSNIRQRDEADKPRVVNDRQSPYPMGEHEVESIEDIAVGTRGR